MKKAIRGKARSVSDELITGRFVYEDILLRASLSGGSRSDIPGEGEVQESKTMVQSTSKDIKTGSRKAFAIWSSESPLAKKSESLKNKMYEVRGEASEYIAPIDGGEHHYLHPYAHAMNEVSLASNAAKHVHDREHNTKDGVVLKKGDKEAVPVGHFHNVQHYDRADTTNVRVTWTAPQEFQVIQPTGNIAHPHSLRADQGDKAQYILIPASGDVLEEQPGKTILGRFVSEDNVKELAASGSNSNHLEKQVYVAWSHPAALELKLSERMELHQVVNLGCTNERCSTEHPAIKVKEATYDFLSTVPAAE